ncbi:peptidoglycan D,D-transpeptidase FtsI family protein [Mycolicibacterium smegmatis]|uniref:Penicillin-binding protein PbpB n=1 Tax=Mycolicibacterium smegmatis (strain ATCC 700084 / mc(2)155) TaxID=246196 RepID=PBPB_MYCS2|nr:penicillin-binding protein 2 [Mycolicibacterium smegmatis]A0R022.1 RecName: Full=Penicillin-binding protein PbpB; AltName: Full=PBP3 [Mycolicibacterium smegmatis MC2 155]ABK71440.1 Penicillin binding protein transpeptidase domain protein [Mycolicibacterium smegmatis MC2 155]AFP40590.1 Penicillin-binding membrane protein PbpB [Mycolicibacterium smegmatis MC2 155]AIU09326.1 cell division protein FtsI [Mycolicibacterium smegmatis MC2 155]AIU15951.1 cell division protein FtsI [Mycolicibacterium
MSRRGDRPRTPAQPRKKARVDQPRSARTRRTRVSEAEAGLRSSSFVFRHRTGNLAILAVLVIAAVQLFMLQVPRAAGLRAEAASQLKVTDITPAIRGSIIDRNNDKLAFTIEARALTFQPTRVRKQLDEAWRKAQEAGSSTSDDVPNPDERLNEIAKEIAARLNNTPDAKTVLKKLKSNETFVYLARAVDPAIANAITDKFPEVGSERQDLRQYPGGSLAANIVGGIDWDGHGLLGLEDSLDAVLAGTDGSVTYDRGSDGVVIPGSYRNRHDAVDGSTVQLTIDDDIQYHVQQQVQMAKDASGAKNVSAVVLDAKTGEVLAMSNDNTFDPSQDIGRQADRQMGNPSVSSPFEPGSVNKIVTAAAAIENGLTNPDEVLQVPGSIHMGGVTVRDAWNHGVMPYTTTGVFGKSSNVGTLMLAQRVGPERFYEMLRKFGLGQRTNVGLPGESSGLLPPIDQWSGSSFSNLPIGQGLSMTLLQMAAMYQTVANDGVRVPPRIIKSTIAPDGTVTEEERPEGIRVISPETARTLRSMFRSVVQRDPMGVQQGTGPQAAVEGYQIAGKTGTAQQINPACGCYYDDVYWITFAGIAPADDPRYVIGIMMDAPQRAADGSPGSSAAPLFHEIASWLLQRHNVPLSPDPGPPLTLQAT